MAQKEKTTVLQKLAENSAVLFWHLASAGLQIFEEVEAWSLIYLVLAALLSPY